jgi:hypothetical protein
VYYGLRPFAPFQYTLLIKKKKKKNLKLRHRMHLRLASTLKVNKLEPVEGLIYKEGVGQFC